VDKSEEKAVAHLLSIVFFFGLLVGLGMILEFTLRAHWAAVIAALRGVSAPPRAVARERVQSRRLPARLRNEVAAA
jgi:hypothetical protein